MLFNSYDFLFGFLPLVLLGHALLIRREGDDAARVWLLLASIAFYAYWSIPYVFLIGASILFNGVVARKLEAFGDAQPDPKRRLLKFGIFINLLLLGIFKYTAFTLDTIAQLSSLPIPIPEITLPLGISFHTFQQIAFLVDTSKGRTGKWTPLTYSLFVMFFPQLIAGPIVLHHEMLPQISHLPKPTWNDRAVGLTILVLGLFKKVMVADTLAPYADAVFDASTTDIPTIFGAWAAAAAFMGQVYFDFSGYSDMAIGLARLFGVKLPANFDAPYRTTNISHFWRQWHITLSRFLKTYVYIPLGGNRKGAFRRDVNLMITMLLAGLWHGAAWNFVLFGGSMGVALIVYGRWRRWRGPVAPTWWRVSLGRMITWGVVWVSFSYFRAPSLEGCWHMTRALFGWTPAGWGTFDSTLGWILLATFVLTQIFPTTQRWLAAYEPVVAEGMIDGLRWPARLDWRPTLLWACVISLLAAITLPFLERADAFIYWAF